VPVMRRRDPPINQQTAIPIEVMIMQLPPEPNRLTPAESFPTDPSGLPEATRPQLLELADGDVFDLQIGAVAKRLGTRRCGCWATAAPSPARP
jgi:hypothetical protein